MQSSKSHEPSSRKNLTRCAGTITSDGSDVNSDLATQVVKELRAAAASTPTARSRARWGYARERQPARGGFMASLWERFKMVFGAKMSKALDKAENPTETLDYSYEQQLTLLQNV